MPPSTSTHSEPSSPSPSSTPDNPPDSIPARDLPPAPQTVPATPAAVWERVLQHVADKPPLFWVRSLQLIRLEGRTLEVDHLPGKKQVRRFFGDRQREQLGSIVQAIIQQPVSVRLIEIQAPAELTNEQKAASAPAARDRADRKQAMESPAIKQIIEMFDATLIKTYTVKPEENVGDKNQDDQDDQDGQEESAATE